MATSMPQDKLLQNIIGMQLSAKKKGKKRRHEEKEEEDNEEEQYLK